MKKAISVLISIMLVLAFALSALPSFASSQPTKVSAISSDAVTYVGNWTTVGETKRSSAADEYCEYTFSGTGIEIYFGRGAGAGIAEIFIDGESMGKVDMYKETPATELMYSKLDLSDGEHTVKIVNTGEKSGSAYNVNLAYFMIYTAEQESDTEAVKITNGDSGISYNGSWKLAGETMRSSLADEYCEYTFKGTGIDIWFGRGAGAGIAEIFIDGESMGKVDMYKTAAATELMYSKLDLTYGEHTVKIVNTGEKSGSACNVNLAYMTVYYPKEFKEFDKITSQNSDIVYEGSWSLVGETMRSSAANEYCEYTFAGKGIEIYFGRGTGAGIAEIFIDGESKGTVDAYSETIQTSKLFEITDLELGMHTVKVVNTGEKNAAGSATNVNIGYFNVEFGDTVIFTNADNGKYTTDGSEALVIKMGGSAAVIEEAEIDGSVLTKDKDYTVNGMMLTINADCLDSLSAGDRVLTVKTTKGDISAILAVTATGVPDPDPDPEPLPPTGDFTALLTLILIISASGAVASVKASKRTGIK